MGDSLRYNVSNGQLVYSPATGQLARTCIPRPCYVAAVSRNLTATVTLNAPNGCEFIAGPYVCIGGESSTTQCTWRFYYATPSPHVDYLMFLTRSLDAGVWKWHASLGVADPYNETAIDPLHSTPDSMIFSNAAAPLPEPCTIAVVDGVPSGTIAMVKDCSTGTAYSYRNCVGPSAAVSV